MKTSKAALRAASICIRIFLIAAVILGLVLLGRSTYQYTRAVFSDAALEEAPGRTVRVNIPEDVSGKRLAEVLERNGLIEDAKVFVVQMKLSGFGETVKAGSYELNTSMTPTELFKVLSELPEDE